MDKNSPEVLKNRKQWKGASVLHSIKIFKFFNNIKCFILVYKLTNTPLEGNKESKIYI